MRAKIIRGLAAGLAGTAVMTGLQKLIGASAESKAESPSWETAPAPAQVARKGLATMGHDPPPSWIPALTQAMHWGYGTTWGIAYMLLPRLSWSRGSARHGAAFGTVVWLASYAQLVPMGIYEPPWTYDVRTLTTDLSYHLAFGLGVAAAAGA